MRICHMTSAHDSDDVRILKKQCVSLAKKSENEVYLVAKGDSYTFKNVNIVGIGSFSGGRISRIINVSKEIYKKAIELDADIYQFHDPELLLYARKLKKHGKKVIFDSHEDYKKQILEKTYIPKIVRRFVAVAYGLIENWACKYIDAALFPAEENPFAGRVKKCVPIYNTPILDELSPERDFLEKENKACCVGSLTESRGISVLIDACYKANIPLVLGGAFSPSSYEDELKSKESYSIVDYRGVCTREMVKEIYEECLIGTDTILPVGQYDETNNLSTKVYEYMAMGIPYITSDFQYNKHIIDKYKCGIYVDPTDKDAIAEAITFFIKNPEAAEEMGRNGKVLVTEKFSWKNDEERLISLYESI